MHLLACASQVRLRPSEKLALLCLADNANSKDSIAFPGMVGLQAWTGLSPARIYKVLARLVEYRLIVQVGAGHRGRAAEFAVFPDGCCEAHGRQPDAVDNPEKASPQRETMDAPESCGQPCGQEAIAEKASPSGPESLSFSSVKPLAGTTPTKNPPKNPPGVKYTDTLQSAPANVRDLTAFRRSRFDTEQERTPHVGHDMLIYATDGDAPPALVCVTCSSVLVMDNHDASPTRTITGDALAGAAACRTALANRRTS